MAHYNIDARVTKDKNREDTNTTVAVYYVVCRKQQFQLKLQTSRLGTYQNRSSRCRVRVERQKTVPPRKVESTQDGGTTFEWLS
jgi:hypothetical protein